MKCGNQGRKEGRIRHDFTLVFKDNNGNKIPDHTGNTEIPIPPGILSRHLVNFLAALFNLEAKKIKGGADPEWEFV